MKKLISIFMLAALAVSTTAAQSVTRTPQYQIMVPGLLNSSDYSIIANGSADSTTQLATFYNKAFVGANYVSNIGNPAPLNFAQGIYTFHEFAPGGTHGSPCYQGAGGADASRFYYGGTGGSGSYVLGLPIMTFGCLTNLQINGVNSGYHTSVTTMAQNCVVANQASAPEIDALFNFSNNSFADCYSNGFQMGSPTQPGSITNGFFHNFRGDGIGGYLLAFYNENVSSGTPVDIYDFTNATNMNGLIAAFCIAQAHCNGTGSTVNSYASGSLFISRGKGQVYHVHDARLEENLSANNIGNVDQGEIFSNDDSGAGAPSIEIENVSDAGAVTAPHPFISTAVGDVAATIMGANSFSAISSLYKNRLTQQEHGDQFKGGGALWSYGRSSVGFQGISLEDWSLDVVPVASRSGNVVPRGNGDWLVRRGSDYVAGAAGPFDVAYSAVSGRQSLQSAQVEATGGTLAANSIFLTSGLSVISAGTGGTISGAGNCTITGYNNNLSGAIAVVTFTTPGSWTGATFTTLEQGTGVTTATGLTGTLSSGDPVDQMGKEWGPTGADAICSGTVTLTATITSAASGSPTYANVTGFNPLYPSSHLSIHIGDNLTILNSGSGGTGSTAVKAVCVDGAGSVGSFYCHGLAAQGIVVTPAPACLPSSCAAGAITLDWTQIPTTNIGLEANRVTTIPAAGTACPYQGDFVWLQTPVAGQPMNAGCNASLQWVIGPTYGATGSGGGSGSNVAVNGGSTLATANLATNSGAGQVDVSNPSGSTVNFVLHNVASTINGQTATLGSTANVNNGAATHSVSINEGAGAAIAGAAIGTSGRLFVDQGAGADPAFEAMSGDCTLTNTGAITCTKTSGSAFSGLATLAETDNDIIFGSGGVWTKGTAVPNGTTGATQTVGDNTTKLATDAFVIANAGSGGSGQAGAYGSVSFSSTPAFAVTSNTLQTFAITLTGAVSSSTISGASAGGYVAFKITQDATGSRAFVWPTGFSSAIAVYPAASTSTTELFFYDGTNYNLVAPAQVSGTSLSGFWYGPTGSAPGTPPTGYINIWLDTTDNAVKAKNSAGTVSAMLVPATCTNQVLIAISDNTTTGDCATIISTMTDTSIAHTGGDINTSYQVTATHLAAGLPLAQGGTAATSAAAALASLMGGPVAGTYSVTCASSTSCTASAAAAADTTITVGSTVAFSANACSSVTGSAGTASTVSMTNLATTMTASFTPNSDVHAVTGWSPASGGQLYFTSWPSASGTLSYYVCNGTSSTITTGGSVTWNVSAK